MSTLSDLLNVIAFMEAEGCPRIEIKHLGGLFVLLESMNSGECCNFPCKCHKGLEPMILHAIYMVVEFILKKKMLLSTFLESLLRCSAHMCSLRFLNCSPIGPTWPQQSGDTYQANGLDQ